MYLRNIKYDVSVRLRARSRVKGKAERERNERITFLSFFLSFFFSPLPSFLSFRSNYSTGWIVINVITPRTRAKLRAVMTAGNGDRIGWRKKKKKKKRNDGREARRRSEISLAAFFWSAGLLVLAPRKLATQCVSYKRRQDRNDSERKSTASGLILIPRPNIYLEVSLSRQPPGCLRGCLLLAWPVREIVQRGQSFRLE